MVAVAVAAGGCPLAEPLLRWPQVKSVSHDLEQLHRLLHIARSLVQNPFLGLGSYVRSLVASVMYCALEPLAASINPLNDHWTLRDYAAMLLSRIFWWGRGGGSSWEVVEGGAAGGGGPFHEVGRTSWKWEEPA